MTTSATITAENARPKFNLLLQEAVQGSGMDMANARRLEGRLVGVGLDSVAKVANSSDGAFRQNTGQLRAGALASLRGVLVGVGNGAPPADDVTLATALGILADTCVSAWDAHLKASRTADVPAGEKEPDDKTRASDAWAQLDEWQGINPALNERIANNTIGGMMKAVSRDDVLESLVPVL
ncbi:MAG: hypothetical protein ACKVI4_17630, partial [Actinomycetales bacterium]